MHGYNGCYIDTLDFGSTLDHDAAIFLLQYYCIYFALYSVCWVVLIVKNTRYVIYLWLESGILFKIVRDSKSNTIIMSDLPEINPSTVGLIMQGSKYCAEKHILNTFCKHWKTGNTILS